MEKEQLLQKAKEYKKAFETTKALDIPFVHNEVKYWCINFYRFSKNSGFLIIPETNAASYEDIKRAFWNISTATALINGVSKGMVEHFNKSLDYLENLKDLLEKWQVEHYAEAKPFLPGISQFNGMVLYYQQTQNEVRVLHRQLLAKSDEIMKRQCMIEEDTDEVIRICSVHNYIKYTQLLKQQEAVERVKLIHEQIKSNQSSEQGLKELLKYTEYFINPKSVGYLEESIEDFKGYGTKFMDLDRKAGEEEMYHAYLHEHKVLFEKESLPLLRNHQFMKVL